jgi:thioredoxin 1
VALHRGRTTHVWQTSIRTADGKLCAVVTQDATGAGLNRTRRLGTGGPARSAPAYGRICEAGDNGAMNTSYATVEPDRARCGRHARRHRAGVRHPLVRLCRSAQPSITRPCRLPGLAPHQGRGRPGQALGRSFRIKLCATLVFLKDGEEVARITRPAGRDGFARPCDRIG